MNVFTACMANNVLEQTTDKEVHISSNQVASTIVETLLPYSSDDNFERFQRQFADNFRPICSNKFASHILQKLISISLLRGVAKENVNAEESNEPPVKKQKVSSIPNECDFNLTTEFSDEHRQKCREFVVKASKFLLNNLEDFVWDFYGSHIMRTCFDSLTGIFKVKTNFLTNASNDNKSNEEKRLTVPDEWLETLQEYAIRLQAWPQFVDFPYSELSSGLLQSLLLALNTKDKKAIKHMGKRLLNESFLPVAKEEETGATEGDSKEEMANVDEKPDQEEKYNTDEQEEQGVKAEYDKDLPSVFTSEASVRCLETLITVAGSKLLTQIYAKLFSGRLVKLSLMRLANFSVQKLLENVKEKADFELIFDELSNSLEDILRAGHTGVVCALAQSCLRLTAKQGPFLKCLQTALDCVEPKEKSDKFALLTLKLKPYQVAQEDKTNFIHIHGALILQAMLAFNKPIKLVQCILDTDSQQLLEIFCSPKGSHIVDAFIDSKAVGEKSREKLIRHMNGCYLDMAASRHGSWVVEKLFDAAGDSQKNRIAKELCEKQNQLNATPWGRMLNNKFCIDTYHRNPEQWRSAMNKGNKAEKLFKDII